MDATERWKKIYVRFTLAGFSILHRLDNKKRSVFWAEGRGEEVTRGANAIKLWKH